MCPPAPWIGKHAYKGMELSGYTIPDETDVLVSFVMQTVIHHVHKKNVSQENTVINKNPLNKTMHKTQNSFKSQECLCSTVNRTLYYSDILQF